LRKRGVLLLKYCHNCSENKFLTTIECEPERKQMKVELTHPQYFALCDIYGPPESVHYMLMTSTPANRRFVLDGNDDEFDALLNLISEEIGEGLCSKTNAKHLLSVCKKVDPSSLNWIGE
jgi:hypothetical protein